MNVQWFIARRYVRPTRLSVITMIGGISVLGIVIGTAALVIVTSLFNGFREVANDLLIGFGPHIEVVPFKGTGLHNPSNVEHKLSDVLQAQLGGADVAQVATSKLVVSAQGRTSAVNGTALSNPNSPVHRGLKQAIIVGKYDFTSTGVGGVASVIVSAGLAEQLMLRVGDTLHLVSPDRIQAAIATLRMPRGTPVVLAGIFQSNASHEVGMGSLYGTVASLSNVFPTSKNIILQASVRNPRDVPEKRNTIQTEVATLLGGSEKVDVRTWQDSNQSLVDTMRLESVGAFIVLALIVLVAAFNVLVSLTLGVVEKQRDIAVLQSIGLSAANIRQIYLYQGLTIGVISVVLGLLIGLLVCWGQLTFHWIAFDMAAGYLVPYLPLSVHLSDIALIGLVGLLMASLAALYPATRAARTAIADAIRVE